MAINEVYRLKKKSKKTKTITSVVQNKTDISPSQKTELCPICGCDSGILYSRTRVMNKSIGCSTPLYMCKRCKKFYIKTKIFPDMEKVVSNEYGKVINFNENERKENMDYLILNECRKYTTFNQEINRNWHLYICVILQDLEDNKREKIYIVSGKNRQFAEQIELFSDESNKIIDDIHHRNHITTYRNKQYILYYYYIYNNHYSNAPINGHKYGTVDVYLYYKLTNMCARKNHYTEPVTLHTCFINNQSVLVSVNAYYCRMCNKYYVNHEAIKKYIELGNIPKFNYKVYDEDDIKDNLRQTSKLMLYGYNVRQNGMTSKERQKLLANLIDLNLMSKQEIIRDIQFKIEFNGSKCGNELARIKWEEDIQFVSRYTNGNRNSVNGILIRK